MKSQKAWPWLLLSILVIAGDQVSKHFVLTHFTEQTVVHILPFLNFILRFNTGASFGFLSTQSGWQLYALSAVSILMSVFLIGWLFRLSRSQWQLSVPISLILGGALGNLIDRVQLGGVVDFIDFHVHAWHFATFNVADSAISVGATWLILRLLHESIARKS